MLTTIPIEFEIKEATPEIVEREGQKELPDVIELTISEVDRQEAGNYGDCLGCLICTALKNRGYNVDHVGPEHAVIEDVRYDFPITYPSDLFRNNNAYQAPFYTERVIGKVIRMRKVT